MTAAQMQEHIVTASKIFRLIAGRVRRTQELRQADLTAAKIVLVSFDDLDEMKLQEMIDDTTDDWKGFADLCDRLAENLPLHTTGDDE